jgi:protoporphyrinogen oxidase
MPSMSSPTRTKTREALIVGGGLAGLAAAARFSSLGWQVRVFEKGSRWGGLIGSTRHPNGIIEHAAHALIHTSAVARAARQAGVELEGALPSARRRYFAHDGRLSRWPLGPMDSLRVLRGLWRLRQSDQVRPRVAESVSEWGERIFGPNFVGKVLTPALQGVHASPAASLHAGAVLTRFFGSRPSRRTSERVRPKGSVAPAGGMQDFVDALVRQAQTHGAELCLNRSASLRDLRPSEKLIFAGSARAAVQFLSAPEAEWKVIADFEDREIEDLRDVISSLNEVKMLGLISVTLHRSQKFCDGFGAVFLEAHQHGILGVLQNDAIFEGRNNVGNKLASETWILGGHAFDKAWLERSDQEILQRLEEHRARFRRPVAGQTQEILNYEIHRWPDAIPHYDGAIGRGAKLWARPRGRWALTGNYLGNIGTAGFFARAEELEAHWRDADGDL